MLNIDAGVASTDCRLDGDGGLKEIEEVTLSDDSATALLDNQSGLFPLLVLLLGLFHAPPRLDLDRGFFHALMVSARLDHAPPGLNLEGGLFAGDGSARQLCADQALHQHRGLACLQEFPSLDRTTHKGLDLDDRTGLADVSTATVPSAEGALQSDRRRTLRDEFNQAGTQKGQQGNHYFLIRERIGHVEGIGEQGDETKFGHG